MLLVIIELTHHLFICLFSGCVTSAETMLIQEQSYEKLLYKLNPITLETTSIVVAISPNSKASIASFLGINSVECFLRIAAALKSLGVTYVLDASSGGDVALMEAREEFMKRYLRIYQLFLLYCFLF